MIKTLDFPHASLTAQINKLAGAPVVAEVIREGFRRPSHQERRMLTHCGLRIDQCWVREVILKTGPRYWALARIVVPEHELQVVPWVKSLGSQPLGEVLFGHYKPSRSQVAWRSFRFSAIERRFSMKARSRARDIGFVAEGCYDLRASVLKLSARSPVHFIVTECFCEPFILSSQ